MKKSFWDILAWVAFAYVVIYAMLKVAGVLNSPFPVDAAAIASTAYFVGKYAQRIEFLTKEVDSVKEEMKGVRKDVNALRLDFNCHVAKAH